MKVILASTSTVYGSKPLAYLKAELSELYRNTNEVLFVPYARPGGVSHETYTKRMNVFSPQ